MESAEEVKIRVGSILRRQLRNTIKLAEYILFCADLKLRISLFHCMDAGKSGCNLFMLASPEMWCLCEFMLA